MAFVHNDSCECVKSELDLFTVPPTQTSIEHGQWVEYHPLAQFSDGGPIEFHISGSGTEYLDLSQTQIYVKAKVVHHDGTNLVADDQVAPVNLFLHSLFSQVDVSLNDRVITPSTPTYPYRAMIESLLQYGSEAKESQLTSALFFKDTPGHMDQANPLEPGNEVNQGLKKRHTYIKGSNSFELIGPLHCDLFFQPKHLLNGVDLRVKMIRSKEEFCLMSSATPPSFRVVIQDCSLFVRKVKVSPSVMLGHGKALERGTAKYPVRRVMCKVLSVPQGELTLQQDHLFLGQIPQRLIIGCVDNRAFSGNYTLNPYNFQHFDVNYISLYVDGTQVPFKPLTPEYGLVSGLSSIRSYHTLFSGTDKMFKDSGNNISREDYDRGYALYAFDLSPDLSSGQHFNLKKQGNLRLEMHFRKSIPSGVNIVVYAEFDNILEIDRARNILFDYSV
ncbi:uncharacterized protein F54H12.2-like [Lytechinus variegatus]|uniref:uncharacterized protein F54H12.2-like n=1 Tax=Lytechinus variegatus TaxID=7654 RepID=UPI001BB212E0|nr:uncharacterized protein F54H12.2-like [Lytechinus variegatus]